MSNDVKLRKKMRVIHKDTNKFRNHKREKEDILKERIEFFKERVNRGEKEK